MTIARTEYERLKAKTGEGASDGRGGGPTLPKPDAQRRVPAVAYLPASIARQLTRDRKAAGLSQVVLGKRASVRRETISNIESGTHTVSVCIVESIERAMESHRRGKVKMAGGREKSRRQAG